MPHFQAVLIEAGHGQGTLLSDNGASYAGLTEYSINCEIAERLTKILHKKLPKTIVQGLGYALRATKSAKTKFANQVITENKLNKSECLFVSLHCNASTSPDASGAEIWVKSLQNPTCTQVADFVRQALIKYFPFLRDRGNKQKQLYIMDVLCPSILVEMGFLSSSLDRDEVLKKYDRLAEALAHGIMNYVRNK